MAREQPTGPLQMLKERHSKLARTETLRGDNHINNQARDCPGTLVMHKNMLGTTAAWSVGCSSITMQEHERFIAVGKLIDVECDRDIYLEADNFCW